MTVQEALPEDVLRNLRLTSPQLGKTLTADLGQDAGNDFNTMQVIRIHNVLITAGMR